MTTHTQRSATEILYDAVIIGAAMVPGRALRKVLIIDSGLPYNRQTPQSHNFLTRDGSTPAELASLALEQVLAYPTLSREDIALTSTKEGNLLMTTTATGKRYEICWYRFYTHRGETPVKIRVKHPARYGYTVLYLRGTKKNNSTQTKPYHNRFHLLQIIKT